MEITPLMVFLALLGGILPAVLWLSFWLNEDRLHPEPRGLIILSFLMGMFATALAYPLEKLIADEFAGTDFQLLTLWALVEEVLKFLAMWAIILHSKYFDEPIDAVLYFITIALGFAALENAMFLVNPLGDGDALATILLGNFRFIGATLLHVAASAIVGIALALTFYEKGATQRLALCGGLLGAIVLHTLFNFLIIANDGAYLYQVFAGLWVIILGVLLACEKVKHIAPRSHIDHPHTGIVPLHKKFRSF